MFNLINIAFAQEAAATVSKQPSTLMSMLPLVLIMAVFYLFIIRPQQVKMKEHNNLVKNLKKGDKVVTMGGIFGTISKIIENEGLVYLEIADNVVVKIKQEMISEVLS
jgi:preprotein translocase subunit YajC